MADARYGLIGLGAYVPERVMTNADWAARLDTSDEWIQSRTGIRERHFAADGENTLEMGLAAARVALDDAGLVPADVDEIILATDTPEVFNPDTAAFVQHALGAREIPAYDLAGSGCAGFLQALDLGRARAMVDGRTVLVLGVELISRIMDWTDRNTAVLFGDASAAAVVAPFEKHAVGGTRAEILAAVAGTDGSRAGILGREVGGTRRPITTQLAAEGAHHSITMDGREVFKEAVARMSAASEQVLEKAGVAKDDVALFVPHQANMRIIQSVTKKLGAPEEKVFVNVERYGNTGSASVPLALWEALREGRVKPGDRVLLCAFGAGFHWAAALLRFDG